MVRRAKNSLASDRALSASPTAEAAKVLTRDELADCHKLLAFASTTCRAFQKAPFTRAARLASCSVEPLLISTPAFARMVAAASRVAVRAGML